jgi:hypothetical protein
MVAKIVGGQKRAWDKVSIPAVCFTDPEIVTVGLSPEEVTRAGYDIKTSLFPLQANGRAMMLERDASSGWSHGRTIISTSAFRASGQASPSCRRASAWPWDVGAAGGCGRNDLGAPNAWQRPTRRGAEGIRARHPWLMEGDMKLEGSCHCDTVRFSVAAYAPVPYLRCYCSICRKTAGGGGYAINLGARAESLQVEGEETITVFHARIDGEESPAERRFCSRCGSALWVWDPRWPELVHPFASAIDTPLPVLPEAQHMMLASKANWVRVDAHAHETRHDEYPSQSLEEWHRTHGLLDES